ncbi:hypothetical protein ACSBOB_20715 [Mesorhizobium sp. ASY16-5R]|uniref:hypothetical protein n=1 Tax=Mesorhizobium sp. ASY16-5R TaxID=3445772 RepID=UPI003FA18886
MSEAQIALVEHILKQVLRAVADHLRARYHDALAAEWHSPAERSRLLQQYSSELEIWEIHSAENFAKELRT